MAVFSVGKDFSEVQEAQLMPEDWYVMEISAEPEQASNKAMKDGGPDAPKAGFNIVVKLKSLSEDAEFSGRPFTIWLSLPNTTDEGEFINGQDKVDWKLEKIAKIAAAFNGIADWKQLAGDEINLAQGMRAKCYVTQGIGMDGQTPRNDIDTMNMTPQPVE